MESDNLRGKRLYKLAINEFPECGTPVEVLKYHRLDAESLASFIKTKISK